MPNLLLRLAVCSCVVGPWPATAQNLLLNPEANVNQDSWDNGTYPGSIFWYPMDSRDCPGSGSVFIQCFDVSEIVGTCVPYSAGPIFAGFDISGTEEVETQANVYFVIQMFDDSECESLLEGSRIDFPNTLAAGRVTALRCESVGRAPFLRHVLPRNERADRRP